MTPSAVPSEARGPVASSDAPAPTVPAPAPEVPPDPFAGTSYPPPGFEPMHARTAKDGDGVWKPVSHDLDGGDPMIHRTEVHPDKIKKHVFVTLMAFDRKRIELGLESGIQEPVSKAVPQSERTGLVPKELVDRLLVVFNGGFKAKHGSYGMMLRGDVYVPPKEDACAVALYPDGRIRIRSWPVLAPDAAKLRWWRQAPPCLVEQGELNPRLPSEFRTRKWGAAQGGDREIRRSALALDESRRTLLYAFGDWITAGQLAEALAHAGFFDATELDINWSYTRFYFIEHPDDGPPRISGSIVPKAKYNTKSYTSKFSYRDFFYVTVKDGK